MYAKVIKRVETGVKLINNIMCTLKKGEYIILNSGKNIIAKSWTLAFLNDYNITTYAAKASSEKSREKQTGTTYLISSF